MKKGTTTTVVRKEVKKTEDWQGNKKRSGKTSLVWLKDGRRGPIKIGRLEVDEWPSVWVSATASAVIAPPPLSITQCAVQAQTHGHTYRQTHAHGRCSRKKRIHEEKVRKNNKKNRNGGGKKKRTPVVAAVQGHEICPHCHLMTRLLFLSFSLRSFAKIRKKKHWKNPPPRKRIPLESHIDFERSHSLVKVLGNKSTCSLENPFVKIFRKKSHKRWRLVQNKSRKILSFTC